MTETVRGPYRKGVERRAAVVDAALTVFASQGDRGGSLRMIADAVGTDAGRLVRLFGSKEQLLGQVLEEWDRRSRQVLAPAGEGLAYFDSLPALMAEHTRHRGLVELFLTLSAEASDESHPARPFLIERVERVHASALAQLLHARDRGEIHAISDEDARSEVTSLIAYIDGIELQWLLHPDLDLEREFRRHYAHLRAAWIAGTE